MPQAPPQMAPVPQAQKAGPLPEGLVDQDPQLAGQAAYFDPNAFANFYLDNMMDQKQVTPHLRQSLVEHV